LPERTKRNQTENWGLIGKERTSRLWRVRGASGRSRSENGQRQGKRGEPWDPKKGWRPGLNRGSEIEAKNRVGAKKGRGREGTKGGAGGNSSHLGSEGRNQHEARIQLLLPGGRIKNYAGEVKKKEKRAIRKRPASTTAGTPAKRPKSTQQKKWVPHRGKLKEEVNRKARPSRLGAWRDAADRGAVELTKHERGGGRDKKTQAARIPAGQKGGAAASRDSFDLQKGGLSREKGINKRLHDYAAPRNPRSQEILGEQKTKPGPGEHEEVGHS